jgi:beta-lactam-binding protein with PASTA domain
VTVILPHYQTEDGTGAYLLEDGSGYYLQENIFTSGPVTLAVATSQLAAFGVNVGFVTYAYDPLIPLGDVITDYSQFLSRVYAGQYIPLTVSNGQAPPARARFVPNVVGMFYFDAQLLILRSGLLVGPPSWVVSPTVNPQFVISQSIAAGTLVAEQTPVTIVVSGFPVMNQGGVIVGVP